MKACLLNEYGQGALFNLSEIEAPQILPHQVLIKVAATSVNPVDLTIRDYGSGIPFAPKLPSALGIDVAGTVVAVGSEVDKFQVGDQVYGCSGSIGGRNGALAEYMAADAYTVEHKPDNLSFSQAAALPLVSITALEGLARFGDIRGKKMLVQGGAGGVGHMVVQIAQLLGAQVYASVSTEYKANLVKNLGATAINYKLETIDDALAKHTNGLGFDLVFDTVGGDNLVRSFKYAKLNGQVCTCNSLCQVDLTLLHMKGLSLHSVFMLLPMLYPIDKQRYRECLIKIRDWVEAGQITPLVDERKFSLQEANEAFSCLRSGGVSGKLVVTM